MTLYYILRDRIPFYLTLIWIFRDQLKQRLNGLDLLSYLGYYFITVTTMTLGATLGLMVTGQTLNSLVYFHWSYPSPIEWGFFILASTVMLMRKKLSVFESYYLSFLACLGGGWIYEILYGLPYWFNSGFSSWNWIKFNPVKVFFFEYQIFCIPIIWILIRGKYRFRRGFFILALGVVLFYLKGLQIAPYFHRLGQTIGGTGFYAWVLRVPVIILLFYWLSGVQGQKDMIDINLKIAYREFQNCGYDGTLLEYLSKVGLKEGDN
jgi:hypothetical protein